MKHPSRALMGALILVGLSATPVLAVDNPVVVDLHAASGAQREASATIFGSGANVLVNVTVKSVAPKAAAVTLNDGACAHPGGVAFALSGITDNQSMTQLAHPLAEIAGKAKSLVIHQTSSETSPAFACGNVAG